MTTEIKAKKAYDLDERTYRFAQNVRNLLKRLKPNQVSYEDKKQLIRSSGSVGANFIEAREALSKKDFLMRIKISRKEAEESRYWLRLLSSDIGPSVKPLIQEAFELTRIFGSIVNKNKEV